MVDISCVKKITSNEVEKWEKNRCSLFFRNDLIKLTYREISSLDNNIKKIFYQITLSKNEKRLYIS